MARWRDQERTKSDPPRRSGVTGPQAVALVIGLIAIVALVALL